VVERGHESSLSLSLSLSLCLLCEWYRTIYVRDKSSSTLRVFGSNVGFVDIVDSPTLSRFERLIERDASATDDRQIYHGAESFVLNGLEISFQENLVL